MKLKQANLKDLLDLKKSEKKVKTMKENPFGKLLRICYDWIYRKWYTIDPLFKLKLGFERLFKGYDRRVAWDIEHSMFDLLKHAIPEYIKHMNGCPAYYSNKAKQILDSSTEDKNSISYDKIISVGMALYETDLYHLLENLKVISYYDNFGKQDLDDKDYVISLKYPIPYLNNSKEIIDYNKLAELRKNKIDEVFKYLHEHIADMWY